MSNIVNFSVDTLKPKKEFKDGLNELGICLGVFNNDRSANVLVNAYELWQMCNLIQKYLVKHGREHFKKRSYIMNVLNEMGVFDEGINLLFDLNLNVLFFRKILFDLKHSKSSFYNCTEMKFFKIVFSLEDRSAAFITNDECCRKEDFALFDLFEVSLTDFYHALLDERQIFVHDFQSFCHFIFEYIGTKDVFFNFLFSFVCENSILTLNEFKHAFSWFFLTDQFGFETYLDCVSFGWALRFKLRELFSVEEHSRLFMDENRKEIIDFVSFLKKFQLATFCGSIEEIRQEKIFGRFLQEDELVIKEQKSNFIRFIREIIKNDFISSLNDHEIKIFCRALFDYFREIRLFLEFFSRGICSLTEEELSQEFFERIFIFLKTFNKHFPEFFDVFVYSIGMDGVYDHWAPFIYDYAYKEKHVYFDAKSCYYNELSLEKLKNTDFFAKVSWWNFLYLHNMFDLIHPLDLPTLLPLLFEFSLGVGEKKGSYSHEVLNDILIFMRMEIISSDCFEQDSREVLRMMLFYFCRHPQLLVEQDFKNLLNICATFEWSLEKRFIDEISNKREVNSMPHFVVNETLDRQPVESSPFIDKTLSGKGNSFTPFNFKIPNDEILDSEKTDPSSSIDRTLNEEKIDSEFHETSATKEARSSFFVAEASNEEGTKPEFPENSNTEKSDSETLVLEISSEEEIYSSSSILEASNGKETHSSFFVAEASNEEGIKPEFPENLNGEENDSSSSILEASNGKETHSSFFVAEASNEEGIKPEFPENSNTEKSDSETLVLEISSEEEIYSSSSILETSNREETCVSFSDAEASNEEKIDSEFSETLNEEENDSSSFIYDISNRKDIGTALFSLWHSFDGKDRLKEILFFIIGFSREDAKYLVGKVFSSIQTFFSSVAENDRILFDRLLSKNIVSSFKNNNEFCKFNKSIIFWTSKIFARRRFARLDYKLSHLCNDARGVNWEKCDWFLIFKKLIDRINIYTMKEFDVFSAICFNFLYFITGEEKFLQIIKTDDESERDKIFNSLTSLSNERGFLDLVVNFSLKGFRGIFPEQILFFPPFNFLSVFVFEGVRDVVETQFRPLDKRRVFCFDDDYGNLQSAKFSLELEHDLNHAVCEAICILYHLDEFSVFTSILLALGIDEMEIETIFTARLKPFSSFCCVFAEYAKDSPSILPVVKGVLPTFTQPLLGFDSLKSERFESEIECQRDVL